MKTTDKESIHRTLQNAMTVRQLIERLEELDQDAPVLLACNYGDYHNAMQTLTIDDVDEMQSTDIAESAYSHSGLALIDDNEDAEFYCPACESERTTATCHSCKGRCVTEDGTPAEVDEDDDTFPIVVLR